MNSFDESKVNRNRGKFANKTSGECDLEPNEQAPKPIRKTITLDTWSKTKTKAVAILTPKIGFFYDGSPGHEGFEVATENGRELGTVESGWHTPDIRRPGSRLRVSGKQRIVWNAYEPNQTYRSRSVNHASQAAAIRALFEADKQKKRANRV